MARTSRHRKHVKRLNAIARARRLLSLKKSGKPLIAMNVLKALAASNLPPEKIAYDARLKELEQGV
jgi:hypothetical protein